jgi:hypothetical protein
MEQQSLPGIPPAEEQASKEAAAEVTLIFDEDDKIQERIVGVLRDLFTGRHASYNCEAFVKWLVEHEEVEKLIKETHHGIETYPPAAA